MVETETASNRPWQGEEERVALEGPSPVFSISIFSKGP